jgi:hypothetical protein
LVVDVEALHRRRERRYGLRALSATETPPRQVGSRGCFFGAYGSDDGAAQEGERRRAVKPAASITIVSGPGISGPLERWPGPCFL